MLHGARRLVSVISGMMMVVGALQNATTTPESSCLPAGGFVSSPFSLSRGGGFVGREAVVAGLARRITVRVDLRPVGAALGPVVLQPRE